MVPRRLRSLLDSHQIIRSLGTADLEVAQRRWSAAKDEVDRLFAEAEEAVKNPSVAAYRAIEEWRQERAARPENEDEEEAIDLHLTTMLEDEDKKPTLTVALSSNASSIAVRPSAKAPCDC